MSSQRLRHKHGMINPLVIADPAKAPKGEEEDKEQGAVVGMGKEGIKHKKLKTQEVLDHETVIPRRSPRLSSLFQEPSKLHHITRADKASRNDNGNINKQTVNAHHIPRLSSPSFYCSYDRQRWWTC